MNKLSQILCALFFLFLVPLAYAADGDVFQEDNNLTHGVFVDAASGTTNGVWVDADHLGGSGSVEITGTGTWTIQIRGSNAETKPANTSHGSQIADNIVAADLYPLNVKTRWVKARVSAYTSGTPSAHYVIGKAGTSPLLNSVRLEDVLDTDGLGLLIRAVLTGKTNAGPYENLRLTNGNNLKISIEEINGAAGNLDFTVLASAARTTTTNSADQTNNNSRGIQAIIDVTSVTDTPSVTFAIEMKDPVSGDYVPILTSAAITATGETKLTVYPGATESANLISGQPLPKTWRVSATHADADSITYSVGASSIL